MSHLQSNLNKDWLENQNQVFLAWINRYLKDVGLSVTDFKTDLSDGLILIALMEVLSGVKFQKYEKNPRFAAQKLSNITLALNFMTEHFGIKIIGCSSQDIMQGKYNQCFGVIFLLINKVKSFGGRKNFVKQLNNLKSSPLTSSASSMPTVKSIATEHNDANDDSNDDRSHEVLKQINRQNSEINARLSNDEPVAATKISERSHSSQSFVDDDQRSISFYEKLANFQKLSLASGNGSRFELNRKTSSQKFMRPNKLSSSSSSINIESSTTTIEQNPPEIVTETSPDSKYSMLISNFLVSYASKIFVKSQIRKTSIASAAMKNPKILNIFTQLQAMFRSWHSRHLPVIARYNRRNEIVREILQSEDSYVQSLEVIVNLYMATLESLGESVLPVSKIRSLFSAVKVILAYNNVILNSIRERVSKWSSNGQRLGDIFLTHSDFLKVYTAYVNNYNNSLLTFQELIDTNPLFVKAVQRCKQNSKSNLELYSYLIQPIQRIPRYVMLLSDLFKYTPETHPDYENLKQALKKIENVARYVNSKKKEAEDLFGVSVVASHLVNIEDIEVSSPHRRYVRQGLLLEHDAAKFKSRYVFLFNDIMLVSKEQVKVLGLRKKLTKNLDLEQLRNSDYTFRYSYSIPLFGLQLYEVAESNESFELKLNERKWVFLASSQNERNDWVEAIDELIMSCLDKYRSRLESPTFNNKSLTTIAAEAVSTHVNLIEDDTLQSDGNNVGEFSPEPALLVESSATADSNHEELKLNKTLNVKNASLTSQIFKRNESGEWREKYFVLIDDVLLYYSSAADAENHPEDPKNIIPLLHTFIKILQVMDRPNCFQLVTKTRIYYLSCSMPRERMRWINSLRMVIYKKICEAENPSLSSTQSTKSLSPVQPTASKESALSKPKKKRKSTIVNSIPDTTQKKSQPIKRRRDDVNFPKITKSGILYKISSVNSKCIKYEVSIENGYMRYRHALRKNKHVGLIDLVLVLEVSRDAKIFNKDNLTLHLFTITTNDRKFLWGSNTHEEAKDWISSISSFLETL